MSTRKASVMLVMGTRPEAIKLCPVAHALQKSSELMPIVVSTGQHTSMLDEVLELFGIEPDVALRVHKPGQSLANVTSRCISSITETLTDLRPDAVIVQGDTATTFAGALSAYYLRIPVVHLEAGLRSHKRDEPFPEEVNRRMVTTLTDLHLAATTGNAARLSAEGVSADDIAVIGNTVIDALLEAVTWNNPWGDPRLKVLDTDSRRMLLVTVHRRENWGAPIRDIAEAVARLANERPDLLFVWPMHANPDVQRSIQPAFGDASNVILTGPLNYADFTAVLGRSTVVLTDSGGIQEEAPALGKPVLVLRNVTERREAIDAGCATLVGTDPSRVRHEIEIALAHPFRAARSPYGDGLAAARAVAAIEAMLGRGDRLPDFQPAAAHEPGGPQLAARSGAAAVATS